MIHNKDTVKEVSEIVECECRDWKVGMKSLEQAQTLSYVHRWRYSGSTFRFCPWCGKGLKRVVETKEVG